jgi:arsenate reductase (thioredoxin)
MADKVYNVLFVCTGNSARSILAESVMNQLGQGRFKAFSAGSRPQGQINPWALKALEQHHFPTEGLHSKSWAEFAAPDAPLLDFVLTVCDKAAGEVCPVWPGQPMTAQWGVPDPAAFEGTDEQKMHGFLEAFLILKRRIDLMLCLPLAQLDAMSLQNQLRDIGKQ